MIKLFFNSLIISLVWACMSLSAYAANASPVAILQSASDQMLSALSHTQNRNEPVLYDLVKRILLPHVDLDQMSEMVVGKYWQDATPSERIAFKKEFTQFVTRTYSTALSSYTNETVQFFPIRGGAVGERVQVESVINQKNGPPVSVSYQMLHTGSTWKIYDFSVEHVSIVQNYHSQFEDILRREGLGGLNRKLAQQNSSS